MTRRRPVPSTRPRLRRWCVGGSLSHTPSPTTPERRRLAQPHALAYDAGASTARSATRPRLRRRSVDGSLRHTPSPTTPSASAARFSHTPSPTTLVRRRLAPPHAAAASHFLHAQNY